jgi:exodeoxyribonuclease VII small subunit
MAEPSEKLNYRDLKDELDQVMQQLQDSELDVDQALVLYQRGQEIIKQLDAYLKTAENTIKKLKSNFKA